MIIIDEKCAFNIIYKLNGTICLPTEELVEKVRANLAQALANYLLEHGNSYDIVTPVPNTGKLYSSKIAFALNIEEVELISKITNQKTLNFHTQKRQEFYAYNLAIDDDLAKKYKKAKILFVDEALFSGITSNAIAQLCQTHEINNYSFSFIAPPIHLNCPFGHVRKKENVFFLERINKSGFVSIQDELSQTLKAQEILFLPYEHFKSIVGNEQTCSLCFYNYENSCQG